MVRLPFLKKKEEMVQGKGFSPIDRVREMAGRGFSEPEMIDVLRREGFSPAEIDSALTQTLKIGVTTTTSSPTSATPAPTPESSLETKLPTLEEITQTVAEKPSNPQIPETSLPQEYTQGYPAEDYIDYIVQSRIEEVNEKMKGFSSRYDELNKKINALQQQLTDLSKMRGGEQHQIITKIDSFAENVNDVNTRLGSVERALKETLPALIESVRAVSDLASKLKREA